MRQVTSRTADVISVLEAFFPGDRNVQSKPLKRWRHLLPLPAAAAAFVALAFALQHTANCARCIPVAAWLRRACAAALLLGVLLFVVELHTVTNFTFR